MDDAARVAVVDGVGDLQDDASSVHLAEGALLAQHVNNFAAICVLHYHDELLLFLVEKSVMELNYVLVAELFKVLRFFEDRLHRACLRY